MRRLILLVICGLFILPNDGRAEDLKTLVDGAIAEETKAFDELQERFEKNKLKPGESLMLFGKKSLTKKEKQERLQEIREQVQQGEVSFRILSADKMRPGDWGCLSPAPAGAGVGTFLNQVRVSQAAGSDAFLGLCYADSGLRSVKGEVVYERSTTPVLFRNIKGNDKLVDGDMIVITQPMLVTGRYSYNTVGAGVKTTFELEALSACLRKSREGNAKRKN